MHFVIGALIWIKDCLTECGKCGFLRNIWPWKKNKSMYFVAHVVDYKSDYKKSCSNHKFYCVDLILLHFLPFVVSIEYKRRNYRTSLFFRLTLYRGRSIFTRFSTSEVGIFRLEMLQIKFMPHTKWFVLQQIINQTRCRYIKYITPATKHW